MIEVRVFNEQSYLHLYNQSSHLIVILPKCNGHRNERGVRAIISINVVISYYNQVAGSFG